MDQEQKELRKKNLRVVYGIVALLVGMTVFPWVYAPLWAKVCGVLGIRQATDKPVETLLAEARAGDGKPIPVQFMGVSGELPIDIEPLTKSALITQGQVFTVMYRLKNTTDRDLDYRAVHSTLPLADPSFELIECFCEDHRIIKAGAEEQWPVVFRLTSLPGDPTGLTVNYTLFNYDREKNKGG